MKRIPFILLSWILVLGNGEASPPNVVFLFSDDAGYADFGFQTNLTGAATEFLTPNLDQMAQEGILCSQAYVAASVCSPSRAGLLAGRHGQRFGYEFNISNEPVPEDGMPVTEKLLFEAMGDLGYAVGVVGKWHIGSETVKLPAARGVDYFYGLWSGSRPYFGLETDTLEKIRDVNGTWRSNWINEPSYNGIAPDPVLGRHLTDAYGDAACEFIADSATNNAPFFLYLPFTSPHGPHDLAKADDLALFASTSLNDDSRNSAALTYAMDRAIGHILDCLDDHNIATNTIVIFTNDNGGPLDGSHRNTPLRGGKSNTYEGGPRVPFIARIPDFSNPGQYHSGIYTQMVSTLDIYATFVEAAEGTVEKQTDGVNLIPYLTGQDTSAPHDYLIWRKGGKFAITDGHWKLLLDSAVDGIRLLELQPDGKGEWGTSDQSEAHPAIRQEMDERYLAWEVRMHKPSQSLPNEWNPIYNRFDNFRFRQGVGTSMNWSDSEGWKNAATGDIATMIPEDAYANLSIEFQTKDNDSYVATNDMTRQVGLDFMLNELKFAGTFGGSADRTGTLTGNPLFFVNDLASNAPAIRMESSTTSAFDFAFNINLDLILYNDLVIEGNSTLDYTINGNISSCKEPCSITKTGAATLALTGTNSHGGATSIQGGTLKLNGGVLQTSELSIAPAGALELNLDETVTIDGAAVLDGTLVVTAGTSTNAVLIEAESISGTFYSTTLPPGQSWRLEYSPTSVVLRAASPADTDGDELGDDWETEQFGNLTSSRGGDDNFDGDRNSDLVEYLAGTSATNPASWFQTPLTDVGLGTIEVTFDGISNRTYILETSQTLSNTWNHGDSVGPLPTNGPQILRHTVPGDPPLLFGRIGISVEE